MDPITNIIVLAIAIVYTFIAVVVFSAWRKTQDIFNLLLSIGYAVVAGVCWYCFLAMEI